MPEEKRVKCPAQFDDMVKFVDQWIEKQKEMLATEPSPEKVEEITRLYEKVMEKGKEFAKCEFS